MTLRQTNHNSHFLLAPLPILAREHQNTTVGGRTLNFYRSVMFRFRAASCADLGMSKETAMRRGLSLRARTTFFQPVTSLCSEVASWPNQSGVSGAGQVPKREHLFPAVHQKVAMLSQRARCGHTRQRRTWLTARRSQSAPLNSGSPANVSLRMRPLWSSWTKSVTAKFDQGAI
jgi:hypothetical protein